MLTTLEVVFRAAPALMALEQSTNAVSSFLGPAPSLSLSEACEFGSLELLDWIWSSSCVLPAARTPWWSLHNFLRSDRHYHSWQFSKCLEVALTRGDVAMVDWILAHFSGCEAPSTVADEAIANGNLRALCRLQNHQANRQGRECTVQIDRRVWNTATIRMACENGQLGQCLDDGVQLDSVDRTTAIKCALELGNTSLAERLLPAGMCLLDYAAGCPRVEMIEWMLDCGYLQRDEHIAASAMPGLAASGRLDLIQSVLKLHSPLPLDHEVWVLNWIKTIEEACSSGEDEILRWLLDAPMGIEASDRMRHTIEFALLLRVAAGKGYTEVMTALYSHRLAGDFPRAMDNAVKNGQVNSIKWVLNNYYRVGLLKSSSPIDKAAEYGHVEVLQFFHDLDALTSGFEAIDAKRRKTSSWWSFARNPIFWAARNGHLPVLEWIQANRSEPWGVHIMNDADDMLRHLETGFKRNGPSFSDENPFDVLEDMECNFEAFQPELPEGVTPGILVVPQLAQLDGASGAQEPLPTKRRTADLNKISTVNLNLDEDMVVSAEETCLESHEDRITQTVQHLGPVQALLHESKNMDQVIQSIRAMPVAWSSAFCCDLVSEGSDVKELADIHVLDRILASTTSTARETTFHKRVLAAHLPLGKTRSEYIRALTAALESAWDLKLLRL